MVNYEATGTDWIKHDHYVTNVKSAEPVYLVFEDFLQGLARFS